VTPEEPDDVRALWRTQTPEISPSNFEEMRRVVGQMERKMRRSRIDFVAAIVLSSATIAALAVMFPHPLFTLGAIVTLAGGALLVFEVLQHWRRAPVAENGAAPSIEYHRALLQHQLDFHRHGLWLRVLTLAPGGVLFFLGFAAARPDLAALIYFQLATFVVIMIMIVPLNRKRAAKLENEIAHLTSLHEDQSSSGGSTPDAD